MPVPFITNTGGKGRADRVGFRSAVDGDTDWTPLREAGSGCSGRQAMKQQPTGRGERAALAASGGKLGGPPPQQRPHTHGVERFVLKGQRWNRLEP